MIAVNPTNRKAQSGTVLVAALFFLVVIMLTSTSMFRDVGLQEFMSGNHRIKSRTLHVANSALREEWINLLNLGPGEVATDWRTRSAPTLYDQDLDGNAATAEVDMAVDVDICFDGTAPAPGTDNEFAAYKFILTSTAADQANATSVVQQGGYIVAPSTPGALATNCP